MAFRHCETVLGCTHCYNEVDRETATRGVIYTSGLIAGYNKEWKSIFKFQINKISKCELCDAFCIHLDFHLM
jgi:hypothetical protein